MIDKIINSLGNPANCPEIVRGVFIKEWANVQIASKKYPTMMLRDAYITLLSDIANFNKSLPVFINTVESLSSGCCAKPTLDILKLEGVSDGLDVDKYTLEGLPGVSKEERNNRLLICFRCEFVNGARCTKSGCIYTVKSWMATESCPEGRW